MKNKLVHPSCKAGVLKGVKEGIGMPRHTIMISGLLAVGVSVISSAQAASYMFEDTLGQKKEIDVEYWTGSGSSETILVVGWQLDNVTRNTYAFGFRWDGDKTMKDMVAEIGEAGGLDVNMTSDGSFLHNLSYTNKGGVSYVHDESGSWNLASTRDVNSKWGPMNADFSMLGEWSANRAGMNLEPIADGQLEGINAMYWFAAKPFQDLKVPFTKIPEPQTSMLFLAGMLFLTKRRSRS